jgi:hypothetical protein
MKLVSIFGPSVARNKTYWRRTMKNILMVFLLLAVGMFFTSCPGTGPELATYTVSYDANGATGGYGACGPD